MSIRVDLVEMRDFKIVDSSGTTDAYAILSTGADYTRPMESTVRSKQVGHCVWNESFDLPLKSDSRGVNIDIMDKNTFSSDTLIGRVKIPLSHFQDKLPHDEWYRIEDGPGSLHLRVQIAQQATPFVGVIPAPGQQQHSAQQQQQYGAPAPQQQYQAPPPQQYQAPPPQQYQAPPPQQYQAPPPQQYQAPPPQQFQAPPPQGFTPGPGYNAPAPQAYHPPAPPSFAPAPSPYIAPPPPDVFVPQQQLYPPAPQGYPPAPQGYPPAPQAYPPAPQGYPPAPQGFPPAPQGFQQGYAPAQQAPYDPRLVPANQLSPHVYEKLRQSKWKCDQCRHRGHLRFVCVEKLRDSHSYDLCSTCFDRDRSTSLHFYRIETTYTKPH